MSKSCRPENDVALVKPKKLSAGSTIGILPLASPCEKEELERGCEVIENLGFRTKVVLDPCCYYQGKKGLFSCSDVDKRLNGLSQMLEDPEIGAIFMSRGGYGAAELLPKIDFSLIAAAGKPLVGYSDLTSLLVPLYLKERAVCIHGPMLADTFAKCDDNQGAAKSVEMLFLILEESKGVFYNIRLVPLLRKAEVRGRLVGGNICSLANLLGTPWEPNFDGHILFLEDVALNICGVHRLLLQLKFAGKFDGLLGVLIGDIILQEDDAINLTVEKILKDIFDEDRFQFPVWCRGPFGHGDVNLPLPLGIYARVSSTGIVLEEPVYRS
jgi:muramoyltetrapeptide carboxypeptidase